MSGELDPKEMILQGFVHVEQRRDGSKEDLYYKVIDLTDRQIFVEQASRGGLYQALFAYVLLNTGDAPVSRMVRFWCQAVQPDAGGEYTTRWIQLGGEAKLLPGWSKSPS